MRFAVALFVSLTLAGTPARPPPAVVEQTTTDPFENFQVTFPHPIDHEYTTDGQRDLSTTDTAGTTFTFKVLEIAATRHPDTAMVVRPGAFGFGRDYSDHRIPIVRTVSLGGRFAGKEYRWPATDERPEEIERQFILGRHAVDVSVSAPGAVPESALPFLECLKVKSTFVPEQPEFCGAGHPWRSPAGTIQATFAAVPTVKVVVTASGSRLTRVNLQRDLTACAVRITPVTPGKTLVEMVQAEVNEERGHAVDPTLNPAGPGNIGEMFRSERFHSRTDEPPFHAVPGHPGILESKSSYGFLVERSRDFIDSGQFVTVR
jgi:hypothetical protein